MTRSRKGEVTLTSARPDDDPRVEENILADPRDRVRMRDGLRRVIPLSRQAGRREIAGGVRIAESGVDLETAAVLPEAESDALILQQLSDTSAPRAPVV